MRKKNKILSGGTIKPVVLFAIYLSCFCGQTTGAHDQSIPQQPKNITAGIYLWTDTCNVYILKSGDNALLIDFGDGTVLDALDKIGIKKIDWILFTHHHREQCQGIGKVNFY